nr:hypothetical protein [Gammaproteobacteria bacterium]
MAYYGEMLVNDRDLEGLGLNSVQKGLGLNSVQKRVVGAVLQTREEYKKELVGFSGDIRALKARYKAKFKEMVIANLLEVQYSSSQHLDFFYITSGEDLNGLIDTFCSDIFSRDLNKKQGKIGGQLVPSFKQKLENISCIKSAEISEREMADIESAKDLRENPDFYPDKRKVAQQRLKENIYDLQLSRLQLGTHVSEIRFVDGSSIPLDPALSYQGKELVIALRKLALTELLKGHLLNASQEKLSEKSEIFEGRVSDDAETEENLKVELFYMPQKELGEFQAAICKPPDKVEVDPTGDYLSQHLAVSLETQLGHLKQLEEKQQVEKARGSTETPVLPGLKTLVLEAGSFKAFESELDKVLGQRKPPISLHQEEAYKRQLQGIKEQIEVAMEKKQAPPRAAADDDAADDDDDSEVEEVGVAPPFSADIFAAARADHAVRLANIFAAARRAAASAYEDEDEEEVTDSDSDDDDEEEEEEVEEVDAAALNAPPPTDAEAARLAAARLAAARLAAEALRAAEAADRWLAARAAANDVAPADDPNLAANVLAIIEAA